MCNAGKSEWSVSNKFERHFAARAPIAAQTPICSPNANSLPIAQLQPKRQFAYLMHFPTQTHFSCPNGCIPEELLRKDRRACCQGSMRCAPLKSPKGLLAGTQSSCDPTNNAGPSLREACDARARKDRRAANELRQRKHRRACCRGSIRCPC